MPFTVDTRTENYLRLLGVKYEYHDSIRFEDLRPDWRVNNFGRDGDLDQDAILDYSCRMEMGSPAPAGIYFPTKEGLAVLDGVQRLHAAELNNETSFPGHVLSPRTSLAKQHMIRIAGNNQINGGHTPERSFILKQAVSVLYFQDRCSLEEVARAISRPVEVIEKEARFQRTSDLIDHVGYTGRMNSRPKKWFVEQVGQFSDVTDFQVAPGPIKKMIETIEACKFVNGAATDLIQDFFDVKRSARKDRHEQFTHKVSRLMASPKVRQALGSDVARSYLDKALPAIRRATTTLQHAVDNDEVVHDQDFAVELAAAVKALGQVCRSIVPKDLHFLPGKKSSIFEKW